MAPAVYLKSMVDDIEPQQMSLVVVLQAIAPQPTCVDPKSSRGTLPFVWMGRRFVLEAYTKHHVGPGVSGVSNIVRVDGILDCASGICVESQIATYR